MEELKTVWLAFRNTVEDSFGWYYLNFAETAALMVLLGMLGLFATMTHDVFSKKYDGSYELATVEVSFYQSSTLITGVGTTVQDGEPVVVPVTAGSSERHIVVVRTPSGIFEFDTNTTIYYTVVVGDEIVICDFSGWLFKEKRLALSVLGCEGAK